MTKKEVKKYLKSKPGYQKWGLNKLASKLNASVNVIKQAKKEMK